MFGRSLNTIFAVGAFATVFTQPALGLDIDDFGSATNDRFANDSSFVMDSYDLSGVGRGGNKWATLVSRNVFVSANHFNPAPGTSVTFHASNDPNGASVTRSVDSGQRIDSSDIWMGVLDNPVPQGYESYDFATEDIANSTQFAASPYSQQNAFMFGKTGTFSGVEDMAVGRNTLDGWLDSISAVGTSDDAMIATDDNEALDVTYEALVEEGDSGAPLMVDLGSGDPTLVGSNWIRLTVNQQNASGFAYYGNYDQQMQDFIDANPIPEPASLVLFGVGGLMMVPWRGRK